VAEIPKENPMIIITGAVIARPDIFDELRALCRIQEDARGA